MNACTEGTCAMATELYSVPDFVGFPKIARLSRDIIITEKIDGTNACICITESGGFFTGSRSGWVTPGKKTDNHGFSRWAHENKEELMKLGPGTHFGEWWGQGINRGYGVKEKHFSLFNVHRWRGNPERPSCCWIVPVLYEGSFDTNVIDCTLKGLKENGSFAAHGFMKPEGIVVYHTHAHQMFKKTIEKDEIPKNAKEKITTES